MKYNIDLSRYDPYAGDRLLQELSYLLAVDPEEFVKKYLYIHSSKATPDDTQLLVWMSMVDITKLRIHYVSNNHYRYFMNIPEIGVIKGEVEYVK